MWKRWNNDMQFHGVQSINFVSRRGSKRIIKCEKLVAIASNLQRMKQPMIDQLNLFFFLCVEKTLWTTVNEIKKNTHTHMLSIADETNKCKPTKMSTIVFFLVGQKEIIDKNSAFFALKTQNQIWKKNMHFRFTWFVCEFFVDLTSMDYMCEEINCI